MTLNAAELGHLHVRQHPLISPLQDASSCRTTASMLLCKFIALEQQVLASTQTKKKLYIKVADCLCVTPTQSVCASCA
jgi:hypothetical protein